jgi:F-type H+-transporting ATPase subunit delta
MKIKIIAKRYGDAFAGYARETIGLPQAIDELRQVKRIIKDHPEFREFLLNPGITHSEKNAFIDEVLKDVCSLESRQFLKLLIDKRRFDLIEEMIDYIRINYAHEEAQDALLKTTYPLDLDLIQAIKQRVENKLHKKLNLFLELDPGLLGGVEIIIGNTIIDGSIKKRLGELKSRLRSLKVS